MKTFKYVDFTISVILIFFVTLVSLLTGDEGTIWLALGLGIIGAWQALSMIIHVIKGWFTYRFGARNVYHVISLIVVLLVFSRIGIPVFLYILPVMAIFYTCLCWYEVHVKMRRPLALLK